MKIVRKISIMIILITSVLSIFEYNYSNAATADKPDPRDYTVANEITDFGADFSGKVTKGVKPLKKITAKALGALQIISGIALIIVLATIGFEYLTLTPVNFSTNVMKKMLPIVLGIILVFSAVSISKFLLGFMNESDNLTTYDRTQVVQH